MADKGYDSDAWIEAVTAEGRQAVMPPCSNRLQQREHNRHLDQERHLSECFINKFKHGRRVFSRFAKLGKNYVGFLSFVSAIIWLRHMSTEPSH
jgi:transposase